MRAALYNVEPIHTYSFRRFAPYQPNNKSSKIERDTFSSMLDNSHLYIISRRPKTRLSHTIVPLFQSLRTVPSEGSSVVYHEVESIKVVTRGFHSLEDGQPPFVVFDDHHEVKDIRITRDSSFWKGKYKGKDVQGEAWQLAVYLSRYAEEVCTQEVLYVGKSVGSKHDRNSIERLKNHSTLQDILGDHIGTEWDIFITPLKLSNNPQIIDDSLPPMIAPLLSKHNIAVVENLLISHFKPEYNVHYKEWNRKSRSHFVDFAKQGIHLLFLRFGSDSSLAIFSANHLPPIRTQNKKDEHEEPKKDEHEEPKKDEHEEPKKDEHEEPKKDEHEEPESQLYHYIAGINPEVCAKNNSTPDALLRNWGDFSTYSDKLVSMVKHLEELSNSTHQQTSTNQISLKHFFSDCETHLLAQNVPYVAPCFDTSELDVRPPTKRLAAAKHKMHSAVAELVTHAISAHQRGHSCEEIISIINPTQQSTEEQDT